MKRLVLTIIFMAIAIAILLPACKKPNDQDKELFNAAKATTGFTWYKNDPTIHASSPQSGHHQYFRVKFNDIAQAALTDSGRLPVNGIFPEGSLIVKELYDSPTGELKALAIVQKATGNSNAGVNWLWGEYHADGSLGYSTSTKGSGCINCHSASGNRDYVRLFELFP